MTAAMTEGPATPTAPAPGPARPRLSDLLAGLPALAAGVALAVVVVAAGTSRPVNADYMKEGERRLRQRDLTGSVVCFKRLVALNPDKPEFRYFLATLLLQQPGKAGDAVQIMRSLAPTDRPGFAPAHFWIAQQLLADRPRLREQWPAAEKHLQRFIEAETDDARRRPGRAALAGLYTELGRYPEARKLYELSVGDEPELILALAKVCEAMGDHEEAVRRSMLGLRKARAAAEAQPRDKVARLVWADACTTVKDYRGALEVLERGEALTGDKEFRTAMAAVCRAWAVDLSVKKARESDPARRAELDKERLSVIEQGLKYDPSSDRLYNLLAAVLQGGGTGADGARATLRDVTATGKAPALAFAVLADNLGRMIAAEADPVKRKALAAERLSRIEEGLRKDPSDRNLLSLLGVVMAGGGEEADKARGVVRGLIESGKAPPVGYAVYAYDLSRSIATEADPGRKSVMAGERMSVIEAGLQKTPGDANLLLVLEVVARGGGSEGERARAILRDAVASGKAPALGNFLLGNDAVAAGRFDEARRYWEQAYQADPNIPLLTNNLAWVLAYREPADLTRAMDLIDRALRLSPMDPRLHGTRGQILVKLRRWKEAAPELEAAVAGHASTEGIYNALAEAYEGLGEPGKAAVHRRAAESLRPRPKPL